MQCDLEVVGERLARPQPRIPVAIGKEDHHADHEPDQESCPGESDRFSIR